MFVRDFIHVDQPFEVVAPRFVNDTSWLGPIAEDAALVVREVARTLADGHAAPGPRPTGADPTAVADADGLPDPDGHATSRSGGVGAVRCEVGPVRARSRSILVPMWIINLSGTALLPDLSGDLEVGPVGTDRSIIALSATYRRTSREHEELARIERATEVGVRTFLSGIAGFLGHPLTTV